MRRRGFTLTELMVTVAVVAVLSTIAAPNFRQMIAAQRVRAAASALSESLWMARSEALKRNDNVTFQLVNGTVAGWDIVQGTTGVVSMATPSLHRQDGFPSVTATTASSADVLFTFNPYGRLASSTPTVKIEVASAGVYRWVCIAGTGRAVVQEGACP